MRERHVLIRVRVHSFTGDLNLCAFLHDGVVLTSMLALSLFRGKGRG